MAAPKADGSTPQQPSGRSSTVRRLLFLAIRVIFTATVVGAVAYTAVRQWSDVRDLLTSLAWQSVLLSVFMVLAGLFAQTLAWQASLRDVGHRVDVRTTGQIYLIGLLAKYVPGSIWSFLAQMELGRRAKIPRSRVFVASMLVVGLSTLAALLLGGFGLGTLFEVDRVLAIAIVVLVPIGLICAFPPVLTWLVQRFLRLLRRPGLDGPITWRGVGVVTFWSAIGWICFGIHLWLLANADAAPGVSGVVACIGAVALGITGGMVAFLSPSGLGVREAMITAALLPYVSAGTALGMALASRLIFTVAELLAAGIAALSGLKVFRTRRGSADAGGSVELPAATTAEPVADPAPAGDREAAGDPEPAASERVR